MKLSETAKKIILMIGALLICIIVASAIFYRSLSALPFAFGAFLGAALNVLKIIMLERTVMKAVEMDKEKVGIYIRVQYLVRFLLTGGILIAAAVFSFIDLWGAVAGIFTLPVATYCVKMFFEREV